MSSARTPRSKPRSERESADKRRSRESPPATRWSGRRSRVRRLRYVDSATRALADTIHDWLANLLPSATAFACQSGYYRFDAIDNFASSIAKLLSSGGRFDLVIGANEERLSAPDLESTL